MSLFDTLFGIFTDKDQHDAFEDNSRGFLNQQGLGDVTSQDIEAEMPRVLEALQGNSGGATQGGFANFAGSGNVVLPPPPGGGGGGGAAEGGLSGAIESINHYSSVLNVTEQSFQDNDVTNIDDRDVTTDNSVNQNINAFGDVNQDFDNDVVTGDGAVAAGDNAQVNTGAGAVQAGGNITDATIATGDVGGSVTGDVEGSIVGDGNEAILDSTVGAASFGEGDATNVSAQNANVGDGTQIVGGNGDVNANLGDGDFTQIDDSTLSESVVGGGTVQSNDVDITADDGSSVAFGEGSTATAETQDIDIDDNYGQVQIAGDDSNQQQVEDNSINDSYNTEGSYNTEVDTDIAVTDNSVDNTNADQSDDDLADVDVEADLDVPLA
jgi:hypothetical protein